MFDYIILSIILTCISIILLTFFIEFCFNLKYNPPVKRDFRKEKILKKYKEKPIVIKTEIIKQEVKQQSIKEPDILSELDFLLIDFDEKS